MNKEQLIEVAPHYVAMLLVLFLVLGVIRTVQSDISFWIELLIVVVVVFAYQMGVKRLGIAPSSWE